MPKSSRRDGLVYSTGSPPPTGTGQDESSSARAVGSAEAVLRLEKKGRGGKAVTIIELRAVDGARVKTLGKRFKQKVGVGGTTKGNTVELQGDQRAAARDLLTAEGLRVRGM